MADSPLSAKEMTFLMHGETAQASIASGLGNSLSRLLMRKQASKKDLKNFYANLYAAHKIDDSFTEALRYSLISVQGPSLRNAILRTVKDLTQVSPEKAFSNLNGVIPDEHLASLIAGYQSGAVTEVVRHLSETVDKQTKVMRKIIAALIQPTIVTILAIATALVMSIMVVPKIVKTLVGFGGDIPMLTKIIIAFGESVNAHPWIWGAAALTPIALLTQTNRIIESKPAQYCLQRIPGIGEIFYKSSMGNALTTMGLLIHSGITTQEALEMISKIGKHRAVREFFTRMDQALSQGKDFFQSASVYSSLLGREGASFIALLKMGRDKGNLAEILSRLGREYIEEVDMKRNRRP